MYRSATNRMQASFRRGGKQGWARWPILAAVAAMAVAATARNAAAEVIEPADARGIRVIGGEGPFLLGFMAIKKTNTPLDDRTVIEFDISELSPEFETATLDLGLSNLDPGPPPTMIDMYTYEGDGVVKAEEFYAGDFYRDFEFDNPKRVIQVNVSEAVRDAVRAGWNYLGFRLSTEGPDRFWVGKIIGLPDPVMTITGESVCSGKEKLKLKCRRAKVKAKVKKALANVELTGLLDNAQPQPKTTNNKGKAKFKWKKVSPGAHTVKIDPCAVSEQIECR